MNFLRAFRLLRTSLPFMKSIFQAYKQTTGAGQKPDDSMFNKYFSKVMTQSNLGAPPLTQSTAMEILNIQKNLEEVEPRTILERYYILFKKNDPKVGGTTYLQSKVFAAKDILMARFPDAEHHQQLFYQEVVKPQEQAEQEEKAEIEKLKAEAQKERVENQQKKKKKQEQESSAEAETKEQKKKQ